MTIMLHVQHLSKRYKYKLAVADLSFSVGHGAIVGLLGPNGAGKTTTLAMITHIIKPDAGTITIDGVDLEREPHAALRSVGALIESPALYPYLSAHDHLQVLARHANLPTTNLAELLTQVGLADVGSQAVGTFSQGMRQRLGIAMALLGKPRLLILDEPTVGLDPQGVVEFRQLLRDQASHGTTILISSHQLAEIQQICDHVIILNHGKLIADGSVSELLGSGGRVWIKVDGDEAARENALTLLRSWNGGTKARVINGMIDALVEPDQIALLNRFLVQHDVAVAELRPDAPSLEDFFLGITRLEAGG